MCAARRVRTEDLAEFSHALPPATRRGRRALFRPPSLQVIADGSGCRIVAPAPSMRERDGSGLVGLHWLHSRGWIQVNASRFSPGDSPTLISPLSDRAGQFAAGELDLVKRLRVFGGWEAFRQNLDPSAATGRRISRFREATALANSVGSGPRWARGRRLSVRAGVRRPHLEVRRGPAGRRKRHWRSGAQTGTRHSPAERVLPRRAAQQRDQREPRGLLHGARPLGADVLSDVDLRTDIWTAGNHPHDRPGRRWQHLLAGGGRRAAAGRATGPVAADRRNDQP